MKKISIILLFVLPLLVVCVSILPSVARAQDQEQRTPDRGYQPGNTYSLSGIENVNLSNGNVILNVPLGSLPNGRGPGVSIGLRYDSKLWDSKREDRTDGTGDPDAGGLNYSRNLLTKGESGGWKVDSGQYQLVIKNRLDQEPERPCSGPNSAGESGFVQNGFKWRVEIHAAGGSIQEFRPFGTGYPYNDLYNNGFFEIDPNGSRLHYTYSTSTPSCGSSLEQVTTSGMNYYSLDGSGTRLFIPYNANDHWTLYQSDGSTIENLPVDDSSLLQRLTDRNGNHITWKSGSAGTYSGIKIQNDTGQFLLVNNGQVVRPGPGGDLVVTTISWNTIWIDREYQTTRAANANIGYIDDEIIDSFDVVSSITLPESLGQFHFTYNGVASMPSPGSYTNGFGEINSVELPSGAIASYQYQLDSSALVPSSCGSVAECLSTSGQILYNSIIQKDLTYDLEYGGVSTPTTETNTYSINGLTGMGSETAPDGSTTTQTGGGLGLGSTYSKKVEHSGGDFVREHLGPE